MQLACRKTCKTRTIRQRFFLLVTMVMVPILALVTHSGNLIYSRALSAKARDAQIREVSLVCNSLDLLTENINQYLLSLSVDTAFQQLLKDNPVVSQEFSEVYNLQQAFSRIVSNKTGLNAHIDSVALVSSTGAFFPFGKYDTASLKALVDDNSIPLQDAENRPRWYGPLWVDNFAEGPKLVFVVVKPVVDLYSPEILGTALLLVKESDLSSFYRGAFQSHASFFVTTEQGTIISAQDADLLLTNISDTERMTLPFTANNGYITKNAAGDRVLVTTQTLNRDNWLGVSIVKLSSLTHGIVPISILMLVLGSLSIVAALIATSILSHSISRPITQLSTIMQGIAEVDDAALDTRIAVPPSPVEIRLLSEGFNGLMDRIAVLMAQIHAQQRQRRKDELYLLQSQINPHFLYNTLETIQSLVGLNMTKEADDYIKHLAAFYRISLSSGQEIITLAQEMALTRSYLFLQHIRYIENFDFSVTEDAAIAACYIPKLTLQPLVENAIYHGIKPLRRKCSLTVTSYRDGNAICIAIEDNGAGISAEKRSTLLTGAKTGKGFGLRATHERLQILYGSQWGLTIESVPEQYTRVVVRLPLTQEGAPDAAHFYR